MNKSQTNTPPQHAAVAFGDQSPAGDVYGWLDRAAKSGIEDVVRAAGVMKAYFEGAESQVQNAAPVLEDVYPEFTASARSALLWVLWHHQGGSSPVGQPIRFALGMGQHEHLTDEQLAEARRWAEIAPGKAAPAAEMSPESQYAEQAVTKPVQEDFLTPSELGHVDANRLEELAKARPDECFLKGSGILKLTGAIRLLEQQVRALQSQSVQAVKLTDAQQEELLDWVSACQSAYHIENTPGHRFGGLSGSLEENRTALVDYVKNLLAVGAKADKPDVSKFSTLEEYQAAMRQWEFGRTKADAVLVEAIQRLNANRYNLTKSECIEVLEEMRAAFVTKGDVA